MAIRDLIPWGRESGRVPTTIYRDDERDPFLSLHREVNRLFDDAFRGFGARLPAFAGAAGAVWPSVEISEDDKEIRVTAEVPGLEEKDIELLLQDGVLTLKGEKRSETEGPDNQFSERFYGRFERRIPLDGEVQEDKVTADFRNGVLTVTLPRTEDVRATAKRIAINATS